MNHLIAELQIVGRYEHKRVEFRTTADFDLAEKLVEDGWYIIRSSPFAATLEREKES